MAAWLAQSEQESHGSSSESATLQIGDVSLVADRSGALFWPAEKTLIVADLHLEKGSSFARFRAHLPPYDTALTLRQLASLIETYVPSRVIALGDNVHDRHAWDRLSDDDHRVVVELVGRTPNWVWVIGNHDPDPPAGVPGQSAEEVTLGSVVMRHHPGGALRSGQVELAGHLHPAARVIGKGGSTRRPAFATDGQRLVLPAFGAYAGGLCLSSDAFRGLFTRESFRAYVCGRSRVYTVPATRILGWRGR